MSIKNYDIMVEIELELNKARSKFPNNDDMYIALAEEFGELGKAMIQHKHEKSKNVRHPDIFKEAVQTAVMAIRVATEGDSGFPYHPESGYRGVRWDGYVKDPQDVEV